MGGKGTWASTCARVRLAPTKVTIQRETQSHKRMYVSIGPHGRVGWKADICTGIMRRLTC
jgi:hypothetical protein